MPKPKIAKIAHFSAEEERAFYRSLTAELGEVIYYDGMSMGDFRENFISFQREKEEYRTFLDDTLKRIAPDVDDLCWRDFRWLAAHKWRMCPVCGRVYLEYSNGKGVACYLDDHVRWSKKGQRWINDVDYRGRVRSKCRAKYDAWKRRGRTGPVDFVLFNGTRQ